MIKDNRDNYLLLQGLDGGELELKKYNSKSQPNHLTDIVIALNECENVLLDKKDAYTLTLKLMEILNIKNIELN